MSKREDSRSLPPIPPDGFGADRSTPEPWEDDVRKAFDGVHAPESAKAAALQAIEARRREETGANAAGKVGAASGGTSTAAAEPDAVAPRARKSRRFKVLRRSLAVAACVLAVAAGIVGVRVWTQPAAYVGVDVNPSLELSVNQFGSVVGVRALNEDAQPVVDGLSLDNQPYDQALDELLSSSVLADYLNAADSYVEVSVTADDEGLATRLQSESDTRIASLPCESSCHRVDSETREEAHGAGMGVGKYVASEHLMELDSSVTMDDCEGMSMAEIRDHIEACGGDAPGGHHGSRGSQADSSASSTSSTADAAGGVGAGEGSPGRDGGGAKTGEGGQQHGHHGQGHE